MQTIRKKLKVLTVLFEDDSVDPISELNKASIDDRNFNPF